MKETMIEAKDVRIRYKLGDFKDIGLKEWVMRHLTGQYQIQDFMAVDGVSFELHRGDMLGIIGSNGAGKSTLLKVISGIMAPSSGQISVHGDVAALLELASGFDGNLTVVENAYLRGAMLGYTKSFMDDTIEEIIDFAELQDFRERPFKQLSSGMQSRLAFAIASLVQPDILILDEVLSVGDGAFQEKSARKMREIMEHGATTIFVSHNLDQVEELCSKILWIEHGKQLAFGEDVHGICDQYRVHLGQKPETRQASEPAESPMRIPLPERREKTDRGQRDAGALRKELLERYPKLEACKGSFDTAYEMLLECFREGGRLLVAGNGGSAADSEHIVGELMKSFLFARETDGETAKRLEALYGEDGAWLSQAMEGALPAIALTSMNALSTAYANDAEPDACFAQIIYGLGRPGDVFLGISTSGNSRNLILAFMAARARGLKSILLTGENGGSCKTLADASVCVPESETFKIQELHLPVYHALCAMLEAELFGGNGGNYKNGEDN